MTSASQAAFASALWETPNTSLINRDGRVPLDRPHELKVFASYQVPVIEVAVNASFRGTSGTTYTPFNRVAAARVNWTTSQDVQLESQGWLSQRPDPHPRPARSRRYSPTTCTASASTPTSRTRSTTAS